MNLLIIGNGFDLAHGLETSYHDFLQWAYENGQMGRTYGEFIERRELGHNSYAERPVPGFDLNLYWKDILSAPSGTRYGLDARFLAQI